MYGFLFSKSHASTQPFPHLKFLWRNQAVPFRFSQVSFFASGQVIAPLFRPSCKFGGVSELFVVAVRRESKSFKIVGGQPGTFHNTSICCLSTAFHHLDICYSTSPSFSILVFRLPRQTSHPLLPTLHFPSRPWLGSSWSILEEGELFRRHVGLLVSTRIPATASEYC